MGNLSENFDSKEFECKCGCGGDIISYTLVDVLEDIRNHFNTPVIINSGYRCRKHNTEIGGAPGSKHCEGIAADIFVKNVKPSDVADYLEKKYYNKYGIGRYHSWVHIDVRKQKARWRG